MKKKLAIVSTHPIQYNAPLFKMLTERGNITLKVFYTWSQAREKVEDKGFGKEIQWDIPLLEGYEYEFVPNISKKPGNRSFWGIRTPALIHKIKDFNPDAILVFGWNFKSHLDVMRHFKEKTPIWFRGDSHLLDEIPGMKTWLRRFALRWVYRHVDRAFYVGTHNKAYFIAHGLREDQLVYAPHAVDNKRFQDTPERAYEQKARQWRKELGYSEDDMVVLFAGKFELVKNLETLIEAFNLISIKCQRLKLLIVGDGTLEGKLNEMAKKNHLIQFQPFQNQQKMPLVYRICDIYCLPSKSETWGLAINEAMTCGRPVIVSDKVGCGVDLIKESYNGFSFKSNDTNSLVRILRKIEEMGLSQMGGNAASFIAEWNYSTICNAIETAFETQKA